MSAKKNNKKRKTKKSIKHELLGLLFIFLAIFGSGASAISDGLIPGGLEHIFRFILGIWYFVASLMLLGIGIFLLVKRRYPDFTHKKMIGFYFGFLGILLLTHIQTYERVLMMNTDASVLKLTWQSFFSYMNGQASASQLGGGMIGGVLFAFHYFLFSSIGAIIVAVFSIIIGFIFMTDYSLGDIFVKISEKTSEFYQYLKGKIVDFRGKDPTEETYEQDNEETVVRGVIIDEEESVTAEETFPDIAYSIQSLETKEDNHQAHELEEEPSGEEDDEADDQTEIKITSSQDMVKNEDYELPSFDLLNEPSYNAQHHEESYIQATVRTLEKTFHSFGVKAKVTKVHVGPSVTKYEVYPEAGVKVSRIVNLHDDLALALAAQDIRIEAPIPGKSAVGIEVPNKEVTMVSLREVIDTTAEDSSKLLIGLGRDISGKAIVGELNKMPHLLIAGATGSGKSVSINGMIHTILMRAKPYEVKMLMIDPKKVELSIYNGIPHLLAPVVTDPKKASQALQKVVAEMERRYELFSETGTRNIESYNEHVEQLPEEPEEESEHAHLPYIVVIVDELADLMMVASKDVEDTITRLAQMARAAGIHLIIATQRPSVDVITGVIKANIPSRIAFSVSSQVDSRTILDTGGAEKLLGRGDMLYLPVGRSKPIRVQGAYLSDDEITRVVEHCKNEEEAVYQEEMIPEEVPEHIQEVDDELYEDAVDLVMGMDTASVSMLQRRFSIGYNRAGRLIDAMEDQGIVGPHEGSKPRKVFIQHPTEEKSTSEL